MTDHNETPFTVLVGNIVSSYRAEDKIRHLNAPNLPRRSIIFEILKLLREVLFPGYFGKQNLHIETVEYHLGNHLGLIRDMLSEQVRNALRHQSVSRGLPFDENDQTAEEIVFEFLRKIPALRSVLATDVQAAFEGDPAAPDTHEVIFSYPGLFATTIHRIAHELHERQIPLIPRIMSEYAHSVTGIDIHPGATIDEYFFIDHGTGVVIGESAIIGKRVKIYQGVTLGALSTRGGQSLRNVKRHPTLDDDVVIYSGASVLGGDTVIGRGAVINSNAFVTQSVPPYTRVSVKNPELQYRNGKLQEFKQDAHGEWII